MGVSKLGRGYLFGDPDNKDYNGLVSILGSPYFGELPNLCGCKNPGSEDIGTFTWVSGSTGKAGFFPSALGGRIQYAVQKIKRVRS